MAEQRIEDLQEEILRLRSALEQAYMLIEEEIAGQHERFEAEAILGVIREALEREAGSRTEAT
jgi:vacuolar-type H+-ATPase subunit I/STV1